MLLRGRRLIGSGGGCFAFRRFHLDCSRPTARQLTPAVAIVGSGPAGMYTADELLRSEYAPRRIDFFERDPLPLGLLRYGVAPDHPEVRLVSHKFYNEILDDVAVRIFGRVSVVENEDGGDAPGTQVTLSRLRDLYDAVFLCHGAARPRLLPVPAMCHGRQVVDAPLPYGHVLPGLASSSEFVGWTTGALGCHEPSWSLSDVRHVVVVGVGNVALDVSRMLLKDPALLQEMELPPAVLTALRSSAVESVTVLGRRSAAEAAFTTKEVRELGTLPGVEIVVDGPLGDAQGDRAVGRRLELLRRLAARSGKERSKRLTFCFGTAPTAVEVEPPLNRVCGVHTNHGDRLEAQLVVACLGYELHDGLGLPLDGETRLRNQMGRIEEGLYVAGWAKRGPSGIVPSNKWDAVETVAAYVEDLTAGKLSCGLKQGFAGPPPGALTLVQMEKILAAERAAPGRKFATWLEMEKALYG